MRLLPLVVCAGLLAGSVTGAWPQADPSSPLPQRGGKQRPASPPLSPAPAAGSAEALRKLRDAQSLLRTGKFEQALAVLERIHDPSTDEQVVILMGTCLRKLGRTEQAVSLYRSEAEELATRGQDATPMWIELERALREGKRPDEAFAVCLQIRRLGGPLGDWVRDEMESLIIADALGERALEPLRKEIESRPQDDELHMLLVQALLFLGRTDEALLEARALDHARGAHGQVVLQHLRLLDEKAKADPALAAAEAAVAEGLSGDDLQEALLLKARALRRLRRFPEATEAFRRAAGAQPRGPFTSVALREQADLLVRELKDLAGGAAAYESLIASIERNPSKETGRVLAQARVALADVKLRMGQYEEARAILELVEKQAADPASREEAAFEQAEILFYAGKAEDALTQYQRVVKEFAGGPRVNDALARILVLTRSGDAGSVPLAALGQIAYQRRVGSPERALQVCRESGRACGGCAAAEDLIQQEALILLDLGRIEEAAVRADSLAGLFPDGVTAPKLLRAVADGMRSRDGETEAVLRRYEDLLVRFPKSHEAFEVRALLEKLKRTGERLPTPRGAETPRAAAERGRG